MFRDTSSFRPVEAESFVPQAPEQPKIENKNDVPDELPWELQEDPEEKEQEADAAEIAEFLEREQTRFGKFLGMLRDAVGLRGMEGFRSKGARKLMAGLRLGMLLLGTGEAIKGMQSSAAYEQEPQDMDAIVRLADDIPESTQHDFLFSLAQDGHEHHGHGKDEEEAEEGPQYGSIAEFFEAVGSGDREQTDRTPAEEAKHHKDNVDFFKQFGTNETVGFVFRTIGSDTESQDNASGHYIRLMDQDALDEMNEGPVFVDGLIEKVAFYQDPSDQDFKDFLAKGSTSFEDRFGNRVNVEPNGTINVRVAPQWERYEAAIEKGEKIPLSKLQIDLSPLGLGETDDLVHMSPPEHYGRTQEGGYHIWSSTGHIRDAEAGSEENYQYRELMETAEKYAQGISQLERLCGYEPGTLVKRIQIVSASDENAMAMRDHETVVMFNALSFQGKRGEDPEILARHEGLHRFGYATGMSSSPFWESFFTFSVPQEGSELINEREVFGPLMGNGGHAYDNADELFASFLNTAVDSGYEEKMEAAMGDIHQGRSYIEWQLQGMNALRELANGNDAIPENAPLFDILNARVVFLEQLLKQWNEQPGEGLVAEAP